MFPVPPVGPTSGDSVITIPMPGYRNQPGAPPATDAELAAFAAAGIDYDPNGPGAWEAGGGLVANVASGAGTGKDYASRADQYDVWCRFKEPLGTVVPGEPGAPGSGIANGTVHLNNTCGGDCAPTATGGYNVCLLYTSPSPRD